MKVADLDNQNDVFLAAHGGKGGIGNYKVIFQPVKIDKN